MVFRSLCCGSSFELLEDVEETIANPIHRTCKERFTTGY